MLARCCALALRGAGPTAAAAAATAARVLASRAAAAASAHSASAATQAAPAGGSRASSKGSGSALPGSSSGAGPAEERMDFPGGSVPFTPTLTFVGGTFSPRAPLPCYRTIDAAGHAVGEADVPHVLGQDTAVRMYQTMVKLQTVDTIFYEAQRQVGPAARQQLPAAAGRPSGACWPLRWPPGVRLGWRLWRAARVPAR